MGNVLAVDESCEWEFVGRKKEIETVLKLLQNDGKRGVGMFGMLKIGKSRTMIQVLKQRLVENSNARHLYKDFKFEETSNAVLLFKCIKTFFRELDSSPEEFTKLEKTHFESCKTCVKCTKKAGCVRIDGAVKSSKIAFFDSINNLEKDIVLFLDNVDSVIHSEQKGLFQGFLNDAAKQCNRLKFVITSAHKIGFTGRFFEEIEIGPLGKSDITQIIHVVTENGLKKEDDVYIAATAALCGGLPLAATMAATELKSDDFFLKPVEMVELLIRSRFDALSSENYPADDTVAIYQTPIKHTQELAPHFALFFHRMDETMTGDSVNLNDVAMAFGDNIATSAMLKNDIIRPLLNLCVMRRSSEAADGVLLHGVFRECITAMDAIESFPEEKKLPIWKHMRERASDVGLSNVTDELLRDPRKLESAIKDMHSVPKNDNEQIAETMDAIRLSDQFQNQNNPQRCLRYEDDVRNELSSVSGPPAMPYKYKSLEPNGSDIEHSSRSNNDTHLSSNFNDPSPEFKPYDLTQNMNEGNARDIDHDTTVINGQATQLMNASATSSRDGHVAMSNKGDLVGYMDQEHLAGMFVIAERNDSEQTEVSKEFLTRGGHSTNNLNEFLTSSERKLKNKDIETTFNISVRDEDNNSSLGNT